MIRDAQYPTAGKCYPWGEGEAGLQNALVVAAKVISATTGLKWRRFSMVLKCPYWAPDMSEFQRG